MTVLTSAGDKIRFIILMSATLAVMSLGVIRLMKIQLVDGDSYLQQSVSSGTAHQIINAPRGEIADSSGNYLVSNKTGFNAVIEKAFFPSEDSEMNRIILKVASLLEEENEEWEDVLPISSDAPFEFLPERESDVARLRKRIGVQVYGTAEECITAMERLYGIDPSLSPRERRVAAGIRYTMAMRDFSVSNRYTFAEDISMAAVVKLKELTYDLDGVNIVQEAVRVVNTGDVIPHLIGTVGAISAEEYEKLSGQGYALNDSLGKGGIEKAMESTLRGKKGVRTLEIRNGSVVKDEITEDAVPGNTIKLTVDSNYQRNVQTILENHIYWLQNQTSDKAKGTKADAGAIAVLDADTGALLAAATAPTYDLKEYLENYSAVANGENSPLLNRVTSGLYRPGSTFKTITATAALNEGIISPSDTVDCRKFYTYWEDWSPSCLGFHGKLDTVGALRESCNIFFYDVGRITGIDIISNYASLFGLGEEMGLETGRGVKTGYIANPDTFEARQQVWQAGNVIQAAIGQSDTYVTPLQMAGQALMIANRGVRYETYLVDSVYTYNMTSLVSKTQPVTAAVIEDKTGSTFRTVIDGMKEAAAFEPYTYPALKDYYTSSYLLSSLPFEAAIKTGTPQTTKSDTGSSFIGFYPADDPDIAFAGYIENGDYSKFMIKDIIEAYYNREVRIAPINGLSDEETAERLADNEEMSDENE